MATQPQIDVLDVAEQITRINKMQAELLKTVQETKLIGPATIIQASIAVAALLGAGAALAKLFL